MSQAEDFTDVVELCALLQCLGFSVKSLETRDENMSQDNSARTIVISCQASGLHVIMENPDLTCSCPANANENNSGFWQVSGVTGGKQHNRESGSGLLGSLPQVQRERITKELQDIIKCIKEYNETDVEKPKEGNKSTSMLELHTPEKRLLQLKTDTPTRYRSLDTLTANGDASQSLPMPGPLLNQLTNDNAEVRSDKKIMCERQSTYTLSSTPGSVRCRNKTSSPIHMPQASTHILENLIAAEKGAEEIRNKLASVIKELGEEGKNDSSISYLGLDVSKISVFKGAESSKAQFLSSPNLQALGTVNDDITKRLKRCDSASTSNLTTQMATKDSKQSRLRRISPNFLKLKKDNSAIKPEKKLQDTKISKLNNLFKPKMLTPSNTSKSSSDNMSPNLSATRKKFSHVKSTIPKPSSRRE